MLGALAGFTIVTDALDHAVDAYARYLSYRCLSPTRVSQVQAERWTTPSLSGSRQAVLRPDSGDPRFIRLIEHRQVPGYRPLTTHGWNAIEIVVQNLDAMADAISNAPFRVVGPPETLDLGFTDQIRAMQVEGPSGEILYLTEIDGEIPGFALPIARTPIDCAFVAVLGVASLDRSTRFYDAICPSPAGPALSARIACLSHAHALPGDTRHTLATLSLPDASLIEIDLYPRTAIPRPQTPSGMPAGIAFASFSTAPESSARMMTGPDREWIELLPGGEAI